VSATSPAVFGALLKRFRRAAGLTQQALAARAGYSAVYVSMLERGRRLPLPATVQLLAEALQLPAHNRDLLRTAARSGDSGPDATTRGASSPPLAGRAHELGMLERHMAGVGPPVLMLAGEPGIGKSRLLHEAATLAAECGWTVLRGGCQRRAGYDPYAPLLMALEQRIRAQPPDRLADELAGCGWLARLLPELTELVGALPATALPPAQERRLLAQAVARYLTNVAGPAGALLVLDDLQWAGRDALDLLVAVVGAAPSVRVVGAYRATEVSPPRGDAHPLSNALADLAHAGLVAHHALGPLSAPESMRLLHALLDGASDVDAGLHAQMVRRTGGVPFFLISCIQGARAGVVDADGALALPWDLTHSLRQRVGALPAAARMLLDIAAVAGRRVNLTLLNAVGGLSESDVLAALGTACQARLLAEEAEGYRFAHDVIREVVEADVGAGRRTMLHRDIAVALEATPGARPVELLAYHYARAGDRDKTLFYLEEAGDRARERAAHVAAEGYYREVVARLEDRGDGDGDPSRLAQAWEKLGAALALLTRYDEALAALTQAGAAYGAAGDAEGLGRATAQIGWIHSDKGTIEEGIAHLRAVLDVLDVGHVDAVPAVDAMGVNVGSAVDAMGVNVGPAVDAMGVNVGLAVDATGEATHGATRGVAAVYAALAQLYARSARDEEQLAAASLAAGLGRAAGDDQLVARAEGVRGSALLVMGRFDEGLPALERSVRGAEATGDLLTLTRSLNNVATLHFFAGEFTQAAPYRERAVVVAERMGDPAYHAFVIGSCGQLAFYRGDWGQARDDVERAVAMGRQAEASWILMFMLLILGEIRLAEGAWDEATRHLEEGVAFAERSGDLRMRRWINGLLAERELLAGRPDAAHARLVPLLDRPGMEEWYVNMLLPRLAWARLDLGDVTLAAETAARGVVRARDQNNRFVLVDALRVQAIVWTRQRRWADAVRALENGLILARGMPYPYAEARLLHAYGVMHSEQGEPDPARERLEAALTIFERLGARADSARTREALALADQSWIRRADAVVTDVQWAMIKAILPPVARTGRRRADDRRTLEAILYVRRTGCAWADLPTALGDDATAHRRLTEWRATGLWESIEAVLDATPFDNSS